MNERIHYGLTRHMPDNPTPNERPERARPRADANHGIPRLMREHEEHAHHTEDDKPRSQYAEPPNAALRPEDVCRNARIPCTRDDNFDETDPIAAETWAFALGLAIGRHGPHWARTFAHAIVRVHIDNGWLEVFMYESEEPVKAPLELDDVFACFTQAWKTIAVEPHDARWCDEDAVTLFSWDPAIPPTLEKRSAEPNVNGEWIAERNAMETEAVAAAQARNTAIEIATNTLYGQTPNDRPGVNAETQFLLSASEVTTASFMEIYAEHSQTPISLATGDSARTALAILDEPWRGCLLQAIALTQQNLLPAEATTTRDRDAAPEGETIQ